MPQYRTGTLNTASMGFLDSGKALLDLIHTLMTGSGATWTVESSVSGTSTYTANRTGTPENRTFNTGTNVYSRTLGGEKVYLELSNWMFEVEGGKIGADSFRDIHVLRMRVGDDVLSAPNWLTGYHFFVIDLFRDVTPYSVPTFSPWTSGSMLKDNVTTVHCGDGPDSLFIGISTVTGSGSYRNLQGIMLGELVGAEAPLRDFYFTNFKSYTDIAEFNTYVASLGSQYELPVTAAPAGYLPRTGIFSFAGNDLKFLDSPEGRFFKLFLWQRRHYQAASDNKPEALIDFYASQQNVYYAFPQIYGYSAAGEENRFLRAADLYGTPQSRLPSSGYFDPEKTSEDFSIGTSGLGFHVFDDQAFSNEVSMYFTPGLFVGSTVNSDLDWASELPGSGDTLTTAEKNGIIRNHAFMNIRTSPGYGDGYLGGVGGFGVSMPMREPEGISAVVAGSYGTV